MNKKNFRGSKLFAAQNWKNRMDETAEKCIIKIWDIFTLHIRTMYEIKNVMFVAGANATAKKDLWKSKMIGTNINGNARKTTIAVAKVLKHCANDGTKLTAESSRRFFLYARPRSRYTRRDGAKLPGLLFGWGAYSQAWVCNFFEIVFFQCAGWFCLCVCTAPMAARFGCH